MSCRRRRGSLPAAACTDCESQITFARGSAPRRAYADEPPVCRPCAAFGLPGLGKSATEVIHGELPLSLIFAPTCRGWTGPGNRPGAGRRPLPLDQLEEYLCRPTPLSY